MPHWRRPTHRQLRNRSYSAGLDWIVFSFLLIWCYTVLNWQFKTNSNQWNCVYENILYIYYPKLVVLCGHPISCKFRSTLTQWKHKTYTNNQIYYGIIIQEKYLYESAWYTLFFSLFPSYSIALVCKTYWVYCLVLCALYSRVWKYNFCPCLCDI